MMRGAVVEARNFKSADTFSKNDPYVKVELPNSNQKFQVRLFVVCLRGVEHAAYHYSR